VFLNGVNFIITRKVAALHRLTVRHLCNRVSKLQVCCRTWIFSTLPRQN